MVDKRKKTLYIKVLVTASVFLIAPFVHPFITLFFFIVVIVQIFWARKKSFDQVFKAAVVTLIIAIPYLIITTMIVIVFPQYVPEPEINELLPGTYCDQDSDCIYMKCDKSTVPIYFKDFECRNIDRTVELFGCSDIIVNENVSCKCTKMRTSFDNEWNYCSS